MWYRNWNKCSKFVSRESRQGKNPSWFKVILTLLYKRTSKERRKGTSPTPNNLSLYTLHLPPSNCSSCSDVPSKYPTMILHTTNTTLFNMTTPQHPILQHLRPLPYHNKLYRHHLNIFPSHHRVYQHLRLSVTLISLYPPSTSAKCNLVQKPYANLPDTPVALTCASKYFQMLPAPPGALQSALRLCKSILMCSWKHLQWWRYIQDATRFDYLNSRILELLHQQQL